MEPNIRGANKRPLEESNVDKVYRFKILLPNGASIGLTLREPDPKMEFEDFIKLVKDEYDIAWRKCESMRKRRPIHWNGGRLYLEDANDNKMRTRVNFGNFKPFKCHILRLYDGSGELVDTFENMWDLTPDTDLLKELPEEYTFETALADLIDNSLQAVWSNDRNDKRLISVNVLEDRISIFDTGSGMDGSDENSIVKWGKMGASLHRSYKAQAIGGKPPYLMPFFGMFGYGGPIATMHLGRRALVSSKTKESKKVYTLHLEREALLRSSGSGVTWRTDGGLRDPSEEEIGLSPQGSFTKVEILEPKIKSVDVFELQCKLKDIYFPYIQCDEVSKTGKTETPIEFQVNGINLAEIEGGEVAITNLHSCNGDEFAFELRFSRKKDNPATKSSGSRAPQEASARLKCVYLPVVEGKENIERILEARGCKIPENYERFSRVSVRRLGRLLPDARWAWLPFMELKQKKGDKAHLLKRCCLRVKCFVETDAGFNPTPSKTDLAHRNPFTVALKNFGSKSIEKEKDINIEIHRCGKPLSSSQLEKEFQDWILRMHCHYDEEIDSGEDQPVLLVGPTNKKALGISSDVIRVHQSLKRKGVSWKCGQKIKILKGACVGCHKNNIYATLEYFLIEGFQGDAGGEARIICRPLDLPDENGCILAVNDGNPSLNIRGSLSLPISVIDWGKCQAVENDEWNYQLEKQRLKAPSLIDLLNEKYCQELEVDGALPFDVRVHAGQVPPREIVAVVRPASFLSSSASKNIDQKYILKNKLEMLLEVKFRGVTENTRDVRHIYSGRVTPSSRKGFHGLYIFPLGCKFPDLFKNAGCYTFSFSIEEPSCEKCVKKVQVKASSNVGKWKLLSNEKSPSYNIRVGSCFPSLSIACFDIFGNQTTFTAIPDVLVKLHTSKGVLVQIDKVKANLSDDKLILEIEDILFQSNELDKIRPNYEATLLICQKDELVSVSIPCRVTPGSVWHVIAQPPILGNQLLPGFVVEHLTLEMFDEYGNHVRKGSEVELNVHGFHIKDQIGSKRKVDDLGCVELGGLLQVTAGYGKCVSVIVLCDNKEVFKQEFQTEERELKITSRVLGSYAGSQLENLVFKVVNSKGDVDETIHDDEKSGQFHTLTIKSESFNTDDVIRYAFRNGSCTVPTLPLPQNEGTFCFEAAHSRYAELHVSITVPVLRAPKTELDEIQSPCLDRKLLLLNGSPSLKNAANVVSMRNCEKGIEKKIEKYGLRIARHENLLKDLHVKKTEIEQVMSDLQASLEPHLLNNIECLSTKEEMMRRIESQHESAAAVLCNLCKEYSFCEPQTDIMNDVVGVVALLGTVCTNKLSRILAEYLGEDQMLAVVCRSFEAACALEKYEQNGEVDCSLGLHAEAVARGTSINGRFLVICLEDIGAYKGEFIKNDPQRKLALPDPTLPTGNILPGFMGYAVNTVNLDAHHLNTRTISDCGLRETLFYRLFGELQIYDTRRHMEEARAYIKHGAVSLDGGILRENGFISLGHRNPEIYFPAVTHLSPESLEILRQIEEKKEELGKTTRSIEVAIKPYNKAKQKYYKLEEKYKKLMDHMEPMLKQLCLEYQPSVKIEPIVKIENES